MGAFLDIYGPVDLRAFFMSKKNTYFNSFDHQMMGRCLLIAKKASGFTAPNPLVGAVIVKNGKVISEGFHEYFGGPHAEINAIANTKEELKGAHIYVNLEPCAHYGKTPPCSLALINSGFSRVYIANLDPNPLVAGKGVEMLEKAGIEVMLGLLQEDAQRLNEKFFHFITHKTPFVALKSATSLDGKIATSSGESKWITNKESREFAHGLRQDYSAILVGINTVLMDDPSLSVRLNKKSKNPIRIILDTHLRTPINAQVLQANAQVIIVHSKVNFDAEKADFSNKKHVELFYCPLKHKQLDLVFLMKKLGEKGIDSILVEGGAEVNFSMLKNNLAQKLYSFLAPIIIGGSKSKAAFGSVLGFEKLSQAKQLKNISYKELGNNLLIEGYL